MAPWPAEVAASKRTPPGTMKRIQYRTTDRTGNLYSVDRRPNGEIWAKFVLYADIIVDGKKYTACAGQTPVKFRLVPQELRATGQSNRDT